MSSRSIASLPPIASVLSRVCCKQGEKGRPGGGVGQRQVGQWEEEGRGWSCWPLVEDAVALLAPKGPVFCSQFSGVFFEPLEQQVFSNSCSLTFRCEDLGNVSTACRGDRAGCCRSMSLPSARQRVTRGARTTSEVR